MSVYVTVDYFGTARSDRPPCESCTPPGDPSMTDLLQVNSSVLRVIGASGGMNLCTRCARDVVKSIAARFVLFDGQSTRDLMSFFAVTTKKKPKSPRQRRPTSPQPVMIASADGEVAVLPRSRKTARKRTRR